MAAAMLPQQYCLRWKHHHSNVQSMFAQLLEKERFCDVTLYCSPSFVNQVDCKGDLVDPETIKGVSLRAHRVVLAACSELLGSLLAVHESLGEPVLVIDGAAPAHVRALLAYMYTGEMSVHHSQLPSLLKTAEELKIKGLTDIRWNNKDEPPDSQTGAITATAAEPAAPETAAPVNPRLETDHAQMERAEGDKYNFNGGPPPLIKLPSKDPKCQISPTAVKRENHSDTESPSPVHKRQRLTSGADNTDDERDQEWRHGNMDISAEPVAHWGEEASGGSWERDDIKCEPGGYDEEEWGDAPADIGSFLHTRLRVDGDNSCEDSNDGAPPSTSSSVGAPSGAEMKILNKVGIPRLLNPLAPVATVGPKSGPTDPRFTDVIKLNDYLRHGRRPQFWEETYVKRVMEAIRLKELEMKQAAEILGVSYGTLYGRYRDAYGCINRPFRTTRDLWTGKSSTEVLERLKRGDIPMDVAAQALGVSARDLYVHFADMNAPEEKFEPIPIEIDPSLRLKTPPAFTAANINMSKFRKNAAAVERAVKRVLVGSIHDEEIPATVISAQQDYKKTQYPPGRWRMSSPPSQSHSPVPSSSPADPLSGPSSSPTLLMKSRPDLTIVAAKRPEGKREEANGT